MRAALLGLALGAATLIIGPVTTGPATAAPRDEIRAAYEQFVAAQNARDLPRVRTLLLDIPDFLWVSDGRSVWGREAMLARMASFQQAPVWRAIPDLDHATIVELSDRTAYLHMPLVLRIGQSDAAAQDTRFLVSILFSRQAEGWRIAALFTTLQNTE